MPADERDLAAALEAVAAAARATRWVQQTVAGGGEMSKEDRSPVTIADFASQCIVQRVLAKMLGDRGAPRIVGEESADMLRDDAHAGLRKRVVEAVRRVFDGLDADEVLDAIDSCSHDASAGSYWTLDPVDGTKGFLRGGQYAISLALIEQGRVILGVMGCPNLSTDLSRDFNNPDPVGLLYFATVGGGAWETPCNTPQAEPKRISPEAAATSDRIRVCESVESGHTRHDDTARIVDHLGGAGTPARLDSQCKYAVVARGQADAYLRMPVKPGYVERIWDHAAGAIVATEAGVVVSDVLGRPLDFSCGVGLSNNRGVICASPRFHGRIIEAIESLELVASE